MKKLIDFLRGIDWEIVGLLAVILIMYGIAGSLDMPPTPLP